MAAPAGSTIRLCGRGSKSSGVFPSDACDFRRMQEQLEFPDRAVSQWFGHGLSLPPDSGIGLGSTERTGRRGRPVLSRVRSGRRSHIRLNGNDGPRIVTWRQNWRRKGHRGVHLKRVLFGLGGCGSESPIDNVAEAQAGLSADNDLPEWAHSSGVGLMDTVARLQREMEELCSDSIYNHTWRTPTSPHRSRRTIFTSTKVPRFAGTTSWEQYRQVFDAIVISNGWDDATAALQLLSHLEGDALNVVLLVPAPRRAS